MLQCMCIRSNCWEFRPQGETFIDTLAYWRMYKLMKKHILIVEDDELVQALLGAYIEKEGFKVSLAITGKEMLSIFAKESIDLILGAVLDNT